jgi:hypothetical protein
MLIDNNILVLEEGEYIYHGFVWGNFGLGIIVIWRYADILYTI